MHQGNQYYDVWCLLSNSTSKWKSIQTKFGFGVTLKSKSPPTTHRPKLSRIEIDSRTKSKTFLTLVPWCQFCSYKKIWSKQSLKQKNNVKCDYNCSLNMKLTIIMVTKLVVLNYWSLWWSHVIKYHRVWPYWHCI